MFFLEKLLISINNQTIYYQNLLKKIIKKIIPNTFLNNLIKYKLKFFGQDNEFKGLSNQEIFNKIYSEKLWGKSENGISISGNGSYSEDIIKPYILKTINFLSKKRTSILVDLGCGDFNIGKNFISYADTFVACDVSKVIIDRNRSNYSSFRNVKFKLLDLSKDELPTGDICIVRQVLQHLSNDDILNFVNYLNKKKPYKYLILTEHLPIKKFKPNQDKPTGASIRVFIDSGIILHEKPFNLNYKEIFVLDETNELVGKIQTLIYKF